jgi:hypothetical protein
MNRNKAVSRVVLALFVLSGIGVFSTGPALWAQQPVAAYTGAPAQAFCGQPQWGCGHHHVACNHHGFYTTDGQRIFYFPCGFPRSIHRHARYVGSGPDLRYSTRYRWSHRRYCFCQSAQTMKFEGPYWTQTVYRPSRGLLHRSYWRYAAVPYYVATIPTNAPVLGAAPTAPVLPLLAPQVR